MLKPENKKKWDDTFEKIKHVAEESKRKLILIIDDDEDFLLAISESLEVRGEKVYTTKNVFEFFELIGKNSLKCVIVDWRMPQCSGEEIMRHLKDRNIKRIVVSADARNQLPDIGDSVFIRKPLNGTIEEFTDQILLVSNCKEHND